MVCAQGKSHTVSRESGEKDSALIEVKDRT
uniref:Uncharacterized protein n=1 Tax=Anguilla anguilla TaxID=7936 RepID=A0A0E9T9K8_ANGAN